MKSSVLILLCLWAGLSQWAVSEVPAENPEKKSISDYSGIVSGLPMAFRSTYKRGSAKTGQRGRSGLYSFISLQPHKQSAQRALYLQADLKVNTYPQADSAARAWQETVKKADPDMGLSYAWDYLILQGPVIYHLHAACAFSEINFDIMARNLATKIQQVGQDTKQSIRCRCGGGCGVQG